jgi:hypothetical protein
MPRPPRHTPELAGRVLDQLRAGRPLRDVCRDAGMPSARCVHGWVKADHQGFATAYARARQTARGRIGLGPTWSPRLAGRILQQLRCGRTLIDVCRDDGMPPYATVRDWVTNDRHHFAAAYRKALRAGGARWARPVRYSPWRARAVLAKLSAGRSLADVCRDPGMPSATAVRRWARENRGGFGDRYRWARLFGCEKLMDEMIKIADGYDYHWIRYRAANGRIEQVLDPQRICRQRLAIATREWLLNRMWPTTQECRDEEVGCRARSPS